MEVPDKCRRKTHLGSVVRSLAFGVASVSLLLAACSGVGDGGPEVVDVVDFDMQRPDNSDASAVGPMLEAGKTYTLTIAGTYSIWSSEWSSGPCVGAAEDAPMFPSPGGTNGPVGVDAEFYFDVPDGTGLCSDEIPRNTGGLEISLDNGLNWDHPDPVSPVERPAPDHTYVYEVLGEGHQIMFRRLDVPSSDNYGVMRITIETD